MLKKEAKVTQSNLLISNTASQRYALVQLAAAAEKKKEKAAVNAANANKPPAKKAAAAARLRTHGHRVEEQLSKYVCPTDLANCLPPPRGGGFKPQRAAS